MAMPATSSTTRERTNADALSAARVAGVVLRAALVALALLPVHGFLSAETALAARLAVLGLLAITLLRPEDGLLAGAPFFILAVPLARALDATQPMGEALLLAFLAGWLLHGIVRPGRPLAAAARRTVMPALILAAVVAASMMTLLFVNQVSEDYPWPFVGRVFRSLATDYLTGNGYPGLAPGALMLESIGLFAAVIALSRRRPALPIGVVRLLAVAGIALAILDIERFAGGCLRSATPLGALIENARHVRVSWLFADVNAAGSVHALTVLVALALAVRSRGVARLAWALSVPVVLAALWITGSKAALLAIPVAGLAVFISCGRIPSRAPRLAMRGLILVVLAILGLGIWFLPRVPYEDVFSGLRWRVDFWRAALRAFQSHPVFGVGVGQYYAVSGMYLDPGIVATYPHENAHNNLLQILAELGLAGLLPFMWLLAAAGRRVAAGIGKAADAAVAGLAAGVLAFLLTCLAGHPLIIRESAFPFWLALGLVVALAFESAPVDDNASVNPRRLWWIPITAVVACLAVSVPLRARWILDREADLSLATIGLAPVWSFDETGVRYRPMTGRGQFYVAGGTCVISMGLRLDPSRTVAATEIEVRVDDRPVKRVRVVRDSWREFRWSLAAVPGKRFRKIELRAVPASDVEVRTGRPATFDCPAAGGAKLGR